MLVIVSRLKFLQTFNYHKFIYFFCVLNLELFFLANFPFARSTPDRKPIHVVFVWCAKERTTCNAGRATASFLIMAGCTPCHQ